MDHDGILNQLPHVVGDLARGLCPRGLQYQLLKRPNGLLRLITERTIGHARGESKLEEAGLQPSHIVASQADQQRAREIGLHYRHRRRLDHHAGQCAGWHRETTGTTRWRGGDCAIAAATKHANSDDHNEHADRRNGRKPTI